MHRKLEKEQKMKKNLIIAIAALAMVSCSEKKFHVEGNITNAKDSVLYFENVGLEEVAVVDSVKLDEDGAFSFLRSRHQPQSSTACVLPTRSSM